MGDNTIYVLGAVIIAISVATMVLLLAVAF
jgi:hypothetical protein